MQRQERKDAQRRALNKLSTVLWCVQLCLTSQTLFAPVFAPVGTMNFDFGKIKDMTKRYADKAKQYAEGLSPMEMKVADATNDDKWGPHGSAMAGARHHCLCVPFPCQTLARCSARARPAASRPALPSSARTQYMQIEAPVLRWQAAGLQASVHALT